MLIEMHWHSSKVYLFLRKISKSDKLVCLAEGGGGEEAAKISETLKTNNCQICRMKQYYTIECVRSACFFTLYIGLVCQKNLL